MKLPVNDPTTAEIDRKMPAVFHTGMASSMSKINYIALCHNQVQCGCVNFRGVKVRCEGECELNRIEYHVLSDDDDGSIRAEGWHLYTLI